MFLTPLPFDYVKKIELYWWINRYIWAGRR